MKHDLSLSYFCTENEGTGLDEGLHLRSRLGDVWHTKENFLDIVVLQNSGHVEDLLLGTFPFQSDVQGRKHLSCVCNGH